MCGIKIFGQTLTLYNSILFYVFEMTDSISNIISKSIWRNSNVLFNIYHMGAIHCISVLLYILLMEWFQILSPQNCPGGPPAWGVGDEVYSRRCPVLCRPQHKDHNIPGPAGRPGQRVRTLILKTNRALTLQSYMGITQQTITQTVLLRCRQWNMINIHIHKGRISVSALERYTFL